MDYHVDSAVLDMTTECSKGFSCLSGDDSCMCKVDKYIGGDEGVLFIVQNGHMNYCDYNMSFGSAYVCNCPTRRWIYNNYHL